ncbi:glutamate receptor ionotropic, kainate 2-like [Galleria mellonella]|uniref:Glutamate receptor ionotropic, kainate 2-like n=1 Tax=Galleria mellonella TaxID=7137 RepID=A0A6J1WFM5_GALME|nr:glutamate receptor ionotropic, kainate 2-like [Galleria mellonella]
MKWTLFVITLFIHKCVPEIRITETKDISYQIAGIFERESTTQQYAFNESVNHGHVRGYRLAPAILKPDRTDSYSVWKELCSDSEMRPIAVVGPQNPITDGIVRDQCIRSHIPHIQATWQPLDPDIELDEEESEEPVFKKISINFYPDSNEVSLAYAKLLKYYKWESFSALYEDDLGLLRIQKILAEHTEKHPVNLRKLDPDIDNRHVFKDLKQYQESRFLIDCRADHILKYMNEARELEMLNHYQHYILVNMNAYTVAEKLTEFQSNITWLSITDYDKLNSGQHDLAQRVGKWINSNSQSPFVTKYNIEALIMDDIANHILTALQKLDADTFQEPQNNICDNEAEPWEFGIQLQDAILNTTTTGVTGVITFDEMGRRTNYKLYVNEIYLSERQTIGTWESPNDPEITEDRPNTDSISNLQTSKHFIVISRRAKPYFYDKQKCEEDDPDCVEEDADPKYEGFSVDLVKAIFEILREEKYNYTYSFYHDEDKSYGKYNPLTKKWDGLIGDLLDKKADLAVCDLTITEERKKVVDFSVPFMSLGISILFTKEYEEPPGTFSFLNPYTFDVWMHTATAYCVVSIVLFVCARISPADWENPQPCDKDPEELENIWNFKNCAWLTMGSIMTQGCDILPKGLGTRWICAMWWFFAMIVCQTYIAQLSASMTSARADEPINSVEDLAKQNKILYGAIDGGSTLEFFRSSKDKMYQKMYQNMMAHPGVLVNSNEEGEKRVLNSKNKYAFFMESSTIEYKQRRNCDLEKVGGQLDSKDYGIAMPANSPFRSPINRAILRLKELTTLDNIKTKWWTRKYGAIECPSSTDKNDVEGDLEMENLIGAFLVLIVGLVFGILITAAEFLNECRNIVVREQVTHKEAIVKELKASLNFFQLRKPVLRNPSRAPSIAFSDKSDEQEKKRAELIENFLEFEKEVQ